MGTWKNIISLLKLLLFPFPPMLSEAWRRCGPTETPFKAKSLGDVSIACHLNQFKKFQGLQDRLGYIPKLLPQQSLEDGNSNNNNEYKYKYKRFVNTRVSITRRSIATCFCNTRSPSDAGKVERTPHLQAKTNPFLLVYRVGS